MTDLRDEYGYTGEHRALIGLSMVQGIGPGRIRQLIGALGSAEEVLGASVASLSKIKGIGAGVAWSIASFDAFDKVDAQFQWAERANAELIPYWDQRFPPLLDRIYDPPAFLWVRGEVDVLSQKSIAIVGTRKPSAYGLRASSYFANAIAEYGFIVVSGLAIGIDGAAHRAALEGGGRSIAILGSGVDRIYPGEHASLARDLMLQGAVVSELALRSKPDAANFPKRNRIISGLTMGTLVVEAFEKGGALITARLAIEQNREVFAVPGSMFSEMSSGSNTIIKRGQAKLVTSVEDILEEFGELENDLSTNGHLEKRRTAKPVNLSDIEQQLFDVLDDIPIQIDTICHRTGLDTSTALVYLLSLEFKGLVYQMAGKQFARH